MNGDRSRTRDLLRIPVVVGGILIYPLIWAWGLPKDLRYARLAARLADAASVDLATVVGVRWFARRDFTIASGPEDIDLFELAFADGSLLVIEDLDGRCRRELAARGLLPAAAIDLGASTGLAWISWICLAGPLALVFVLCC